MKIGLKVLLIFSFAFSLIVGEELCCDDIFENETTHSDVVQVSHDEDANSLHFCEDSSPSEQTTHSDNHLCIGCSHAPFTQLSDLKIVLSNSIHKSIFFEKDIHIPHPFLDGPFQPPRA